MAKQNTDDTGNVLAAAAKAIGKAAGKVAALTGATGEPEPQPAQSARMAAPPQPKTHGKLVKKDKSRLPRRQKKALKKTREVNPAA